MRILKKAHADNRRQRKKDRSHDVVTRQVMTDEEIKTAALRHYSHARYSFARTLSQNGYRKRDGSEPTAQEIRDAFVIAERCDAILELEENAKRIEAAGLEFCLKFGKLM